MAAAAYQLKSDLARVCLPAPGRTAPRRLAWANSICLLFLLVGVVGNQSRLSARKAAPPLEQPAPVIIEPLPLVSPPAVEAKPDESQNDDPKPLTPSIQAVTLETPAIHFAVPTPGNLLAPMSVAPTPAETPLKQAAPVKRAPTRIQSSGAGGERPNPVYPRMYQEMGIQGTVVLQFTVNDAARVVSVEIKRSSGSSALDQHTADFIKSRWMVPSVNGGHVFQVSIKFQLKKSD